MKPNETDLKLIHKHLLGKEPSLLPYLAVAQCFFPLQNAPVMPEEVAEEFRQLLKEQKGKRR